LQAAANALHGPSRLKGPEIADVRHPGVLIIVANGPCIPNVIDFFEYHPITPLLNILN